MADAEPTTGAALKKEWVRREKKVLADLGFKSKPGDEYAIALGDEWTGNLWLRKKAAGGGAKTVFFHPPSCSVSHVPTEELIRELSGAGPKDPRRFTLLGMDHDMPPAALSADLQDLNPSDTAEVDDAVRRTRDMMTGHILPWMRTHADLDVLAAALEAPGASLEDQRLQSLAVVSHFRGDRERALTILDEFTGRFTDTGIPQNDEPNTRFASGFRELLGA